MSDSPSELQLKNCLVQEDFFFKKNFKIFNSYMRSLVRAIWLRHLSPHWSPGLIRLIWLARLVSPSSLTAPCASLPKLRARSKRTTIPDRGGPVFGQGYTSSCAPLLEPPNKRTFKQIHIKDFFHLSPFYLVSFIFIPEGSHITLCTTLLFWHFCEEKL